MTSLPPPHHHTLNAALGWLQLGLPADAQSELDRLPEELRTQFVPLETQFAIHAEKPKWDAAFAVAEQCVQLHPKEAGGWIHRAYAARRKPGGGVEEAFELLFPAAVKFPDEVTIPYNLACYCAQLDRLDEAWRWYRAARELGEPAKLRRMALADDDLRPLWAQITQLA
jgi:hypothetical protein